MTNFNKTEIEHVIKLLEDRRECYDRPDVVPQYKTALTRMIEKAYKMRAEMD